MLHCRPYPWAQGVELSHHQTEARHSTRQTTITAERGTSSIGLPLPCIRYLVVSARLSLVPLMCGNAIEGCLVQCLHLSHSIRLTDSSVRRAREFSNRRSFVHRGRDSP